MQKGESGRSREERFTGDSEQVLVIDAVSSLWNKLLFTLGSVDMGVGKILQIILLQRENKMII